MQVQASEKTHVAAPIDKEGEMRSTFPVFILGNIIVLNFGFDADHRQEREEVHET